MIQLLRLFLALSTLGVACCSRDGTTTAQRRDTVVVRVATASSDSFIIVGAVLELTPAKLKIRPAESSDSNRYALRESYARSQVLRVGLDSTHCKEEYDRAAIQWNGSAREPTRSSDTIFVKQPDREGVHERHLGTILDVTAEHLTLLDGSTGLATMYSREIVRRVGLDRSHCKEVENNIASYWNRTRSVLVSSIQRFSLLGLDFGFLDGLPRGLDLAFAMVLLIAVLGYGGYRAYESIIVARGFRELNLMKLRMEVDKLRYEVSSLTERVGATPPATPGHALATPADHQATAHPWRLPKIHGGAFLKHKLLRLPSEAETQTRTERWRERWKSYGAKRVWQPAIMYRVWQVANLYATVMVGALGFGALVDAALSLTMAEELGGSVSVLGMLMFAGLALLCLSGFLRLRLGWRAMKTTYAEYRRAGKPEGLVAGAH